MKKDALRCHIIGGLLEVSKHTGRGEVLLVVRMEMDLMQDCKELVKELPGSEILDVQN